MPLTLFGNGEGENLSESGFTGLAGLGLCYSCRYGYGMFYPPLSPPKRGIAAIAIVESYSSIVIASYRGQL
ncbi:MAG TPA: hypothetical protein VIG72_04640 [Pontibacter sp.]